MNIDLKYDLENVDWQEITELNNAAFDASLKPGQFETIFNNSYEICLAVCDGTVVGSVYAISDGVLDATIHGLAVHPDFQKRGIGTRLLKGILARLDSLSILLTTEQDFIEYYRELGFKRHTSTMALRFPASELE